MKTIERLHWLDTLDTNTFISAFYHCIVNNWDALALFPLFRLLLSFDCESAANKEKMILLNQWLVCTMIFHWTVKSDRDVSCFSGCSSFQVDKFTDWVHRLCKYSSVDAWMKWICQQTFLLPLFIAKNELTPSGRRQNVTHISTSSFSTCQVFSWFDMSVLTQTFHSQDYYHVAFFPIQVVPPTDCFCGRTNPSPNLMFHSKQIISSISSPTLKKWLLLS